MELSEKLTNFATTVLEEAMEEHKKLLRDIEIEYTEKTKAYEQKLMEKYAKETEKVKANIEETRNHLTVEENMKTKQEFMRLRDKFTEKVFKEIHDKLIDYTRSDDYKNYLIQCAKTAKGLLDADDITVYILKEDDRFKPDIESLGVTVLYADKTEDEFIGGLTATAKDKNFIVNLSMGEKMAEKRENFTF